MVLDDTMEPATRVVRPPRSDAGRGLSRSVSTIRDALGDEQHPMMPSQIGDAIAAGPWPQGYARETIQRGLSTLAGLGLADSAEGRWWRCG